MLHINKRIAQAAGSLLVVLLVLICANVFMRYVIGNPINWVDQITGYFLVYFTFLGAPWVLANRGHVAIEVIYENLPLRTKRWNGIAIDFVGFVYSLFFTYLGIIECIKLVAKESAFVDVIEIPQVLIYWVIPVGSFLLALQFLANILTHSRRHGPESGVGGESSPNG